VLLGGGVRPAAGACTESGNFTLDTRLVGGLSCEWISPANLQPFRIGEPIPIQVRLLQVAGGVVATNCGVQVKLYLPNGTSYYSAYLADDGVTANDAERGDGIYSGQMTAPTLLPEGDYVLELYAGYPRWMNDPRFVRSQQIIRIGDTTQDLFNVTLDLQCAQTDPFLIGHAIDASATLHCALGDIVPGSTSVRLKITPPTGAAASGSAWSEVRMIVFYKGVGQLNYWFAYPSGIQWEPFEMGVTAVKTAGGGPIGDVTAVGAISGADTSSVRFPPTSSGGIATTSFAPPKSGAYQVVFSVDTSDYYFPASVTGNFSVAVNNLPLLNAVNKIVDDAITTINLIHREAVDCAWDAQYLYPFAVDDANKTDFLLTGRPRPSTLRARPLARALITAWRIWVRS